MAMVETVVGRIVNWERLQNTVSGNPRYLVTLDGDVHYYSQSDAAWCHGFGVDEGLRTGDRVRVTLTRAGRISHMGPAK